MFNFDREFITIIRVILYALKHISFIEFISTPLLKLIDKSKLIENKAKILIVKQIEIVFNAIFFDKKPKLNLNWRKSQYHS